MYGSEDGSTGCVANLYTCKRIGVHALAYGVAVLASATASKPGRGNRIRGYLHAQAARHLGGQAIERLHSRAAFRQVKT